MEDPFNYSYHPWFDIQSCYIFNSQIGMQWNMNTCILSVTCLTLFVKRWFDMKLLDDLSSAV